MTGTETEQMCRLVVRGPSRQIEVAVPVGVVVADLLPALLHHLGDGLADTGLSHGGWVLQRAGSPPLDEESTVTALDLRDGDLVHLRPRADQLPEVDFDDLVDGMATGVRDRPGRWRPELIRPVVLALAGLLLGVGLVALLMPGPVLLRAVAALAVATVALGGGAAVVRAGGERGFGVLLAVAATGYAGLAGLVLPGDGAAVGPGLTGPQVLGGTATGAAVAVLAAVLLGAATPVFVAGSTALLLGVLGGAVATVGGRTGPQAGAVVAVAATALVLMVPLFAFRLAGLRLAPLPTRPEHLQEDIDPEPAGPLMDRARAVDRLMTALYAGLAAATAVALLSVAYRAGWAETTLVLLVALVWSLNARPMTSAWHRLTQAVPALVGPTAVAVQALAGAGPLGRVVALGVLPVAVPALLLAGRSLTGWRLTPYWGRVGDLTLTAAAVALLPIGLAVLHVYDYFRAIGG
ncbi:type VII secretion integral membrane protein EccD [Micromonospora sp. RL09-050-HVF-A]|uniref:type VII secretion integral membrane protein EccD n=1 Tax=Micromonospora sp. RL09-050-HVF-A TaxID=1703433 RepID=UPI001C5E1487|nr:type VII secretion integral membrane protein EccD [Micromonospora sp. RL09-050-HVF-A]MBW4701850.1 type VII secretion integral membrane protein EccD [Micromonospora sp. RL09-050-HVF-A]